MKKQVFKGSPDEVIKQMQRSSWFGENGIASYMNGVALRAEKFSGVKIRYDKAENLLNDLVSVNILWRRGDEYGEK